MQAATELAKALGTRHRTRLREMWRSAGWPCRDAVELDLLAAGLLDSHRDGDGRETLHPSPAGLAWLAAARRRAQAGLDAHEALVEHVAREMQRAGRITWRRLALRAPLAQEDGRTSWVMAMPDVFSIRHTTVEDYVEPVVHEIKVSRADLLADLKRPAKGQAYLALASQCWYVVRAGLCDPDELPACYGLLLARDEAGQQRLDVVRPAPRRPMKPGLALWMALARAAAEPAPEDCGQDGLMPADVPTDRRAHSATPSR